MDNFNGLQIIVTNISKVVFNKRKKGMISITIIKTYKIHEENLILLNNKKKMVLILALLFLN